VNTLDTTKTTECAAIKDRAALTLAIQQACSPGGDLRGFEHLPADGSEKSLAVSFSILHGIVNEYFDGGDQITERCTCGKHEGQPRMFNSPSTKFFEEGQWPRA